MPQLIPIYFSHIYIVEILTILTLIIIISKVILPNILMILVSRNIISKL